jgi:formate C-acetyltransferase
MPFGSWRVVAASLSPTAASPIRRWPRFTKYRKTHNDGVFDAYTPEIRRARSSHIVTGLPDAYGRGRIIGDYHGWRSTASISWSPTRSVSVVS